MHTLILEKIRLPKISLALSPADLEYGRLFRIASLFLSAVFLISAVWYVAEVYYAFKLGYEMRRQEAIAKKIETEYIKNQNILMREITPEKILKSAAAQSMVEVVSLKYLQSEDFFVQAR